MKRILFPVLLVLTVLVTSCSFDRGPGAARYDQNNPGFNYEFEGDMYFAVAYDPLSSWGNHYIKANKDSINLREPVPGTIARGKRDFVYPYANSTPGYEQAGRELKLPAGIDSTNEKVVAEGKEAYLKYCWQCHGQEGNGDGPVWASGKFPPSSWKSYNSDYIRGLQVGKAYHTITYGKNLMGAHGSQVTPKERWKIVAFIKNVAWKDYKPEAKAKESADKMEASSKTEKENKK